ncbi:Transcriptional regulator, DeoR family [Sulfitobacter donghicola DSW-25 = KCTC 12864 = JCM 14565]|uniref:DeoR faimly transcriptional regulator n=2 Tax=Sulfitobacter TaxID=60136 RepID=A0A073IW70_9RHOB|nr:DeoR faimly transcriptional regulator [Sulfitobacter donghicola DSW-25 = KCTC 12864 = JCM 14565]KIN69451.1 Transcriptional regulator, DeoR family [Sulfitobacter donghicola DSW-25 = KCTC 12864 = JCM 14565]
MRHVHSSGFVSIDHLAEQHNVSPQTIRRDVNFLTEAGEIRRVRGGVDIPVQSKNLLYAHRSALNLGAKQRIAQLVAEHIEDGVSLAVSIGTTPELVVAALKDKSELSIFTNNLNVAMLACQHPDWSVTLPGGAVRLSDCDILGPQVEDFFARYCVDYGIFGVGGVAPDGSLLDFTEEEVQCRAAIQANCNAAYLALDHSKFGRRAHVRGGDIAALDKVFCDALPPAAISDVLAKSNTPIFTPQESLSHV